MNEPETETPFNQEVAMVTCIGWLRTLTDSTPDCEGDDIGDAAFDVLVDTPSLAGLRYILPEYAFDIAVRFGARLAIAVLANPLRADRDVKAAIDWLHKEIMEREAYSREEKARCVKRAVAS